MFLTDLSGADPEICAHAPSGRQAVLWYQASNVGQAVLREQASKGIKPATLGKLYYGSKPARGPRSKPARGSSQQRWASCTMAASQQGDQASNVGQAVLREQASKGIKPSYIGQAVLREQASKGIVSSNQNFGRFAIQCQ